MLTSDFATNPEVYFDAHQCLAALYLLLGEADEAAAAARIVLNISRGDESLILQYIAGIAALRRDGRRAARLMGFIDALLERVPSQRDSIQQRTWDVLCSSVAMQLEPDVVALFRAEGRQLSVKAAEHEGRAVLALS